MMPHALSSDDATPTVLHLDVVYERHGRRRELKLVRLSFLHDPDPPGGYAERRDRTSGSISVLFLLHDHYTKSTPRPAQRTGRPCYGS